MHGKVCCDDILPLYRDEIISVLGALSVRAMRSVDDGLSAALALGE